LQLLKLFLCIFLKIEIQQNISPWTRQQGLICKQTKGWFWNEMYRSFFVTPAFVKFSVRRETLKLYI